MPRDATALTRGSARRIRAKLDSRNPDAPSGLSVQAATGMLQQSNSSQLFVGGGKFRRSLHDLLIEFVGDTLLLAPELCLLHPDGCLIRRYAQKKCLRLPRKILSLSRCYDHAEFAL